MSIRSTAVAVALATGAFATTAAEAADSCVPPRQAEALLLTVAPALIGTAAVTCAGVLPPGAYLRRSVAALSAKFAGEGDAAWPLAREALKLLAGPNAAALLETDAARPMVPALVAPLLAKEIKAADCPAIDRVLSLIDPLPARNTAALLVTIIDLTGRDKSKTGGRGFTICRPEPAKP